MKKIVILTGAGISAESGLKTFRGQGGLWEGTPIEQVATPEAFYADPEKVYRFYNIRRAQLQHEEIKPNPGHLALALLEKKFPGSVVIVTQNVDNLHERAGSQNIIHMHGELNKVRCLSSGKTYHWTEDLNGSTPHPDNLEGPLRPDIVWFGEMPFFMDQIEAALTACDLFVSIGTSGAVYPAAGFVHMAGSLGKDTLEINLEPSEGSAAFHESRLGKAGDLVPLWVDEITQKL